MPVVRTERECVAVSFSLMFRIEFGILWCGKTNEWMNERDFVSIFTSFLRYHFKMTTLLQKLSGWNIYEVIKLNNMHTPESHSDFNKIWIKWCWRGRTVNILCRLNDVAEWSGAGERVVAVRAEWWTLYDSRGEHSSTLTDLQRHQV